MLQFTGEVVGIDPGLGAIFFLTHLFALGINIHTIFLETEPQPDTGHHMTDINDDEDEASETTEIVLSLLRVLLEGTVKEELQWLGQSVEVNKSEDLEAVVFSGLIHEQLWDSGDNIKNEVSGQVVLANVDKVLMSSGLLNEVEQDLNQLDDVDSNLKLVELVLPWELWVDLETSWCGTGDSLFCISTGWYNITNTVSICSVSLGIYALAFVEMRENIQIW